MEQMIRLAIPVALTYLGQMTMHFVDLVAVGRVGPEAIGGVSLGGAFFFTAMIVGAGLITGLDFLVAHAHGSGRRDDCHRSLIQALLLITVLSIPLTLIPWSCSWFLTSFGVAPDVARETGPYLRILSWSMWPTLVFIACRQYLQALGYPRVPLLILLGANIVNILGNYFLVFGHGGFPRMSTEGSAWATLISRTLMAVAVFAIIGLSFSSDLRRVTWRLDGPLMKKILSLGLPASMQMLLEVGAFSLASALAARLGAVSLAAHQIVLNTASLTFMVPLGVSSATAVLVGQELGRGNPQMAARYGWYGFQLGMSFMFVTCFLMLVFPELILKVYTNDPAVIHMGRSLLFLAALFQLCDGAQVVGTGALRGVADTRRSMVANFIGHWLVGLPLGVFLCFQHHQGIQGLWTGLSLGLTVVAVILVFLWMREARQLTHGEMPLRALR